MLLVLAVAAAGAALPAAGSELEISTPGLAREVPAATELSVRAEISNHGLEPWAPELGFALAYHWFNEHGEVVEWDGRRSPLGNVVAPGERTLVAATVLTPKRAGRYLLQWDVVQEGVVWLSQVDPAPVAPRPITVVADYAFTLLRVDTPRVLTAGGGRRASATLRNDGRRAWPADGTVAWAYHWMDDSGEVVEWEGRRTPLDHPVAPGETIELETGLTGPAHAGRYLLQWDMVAEGICWFSERARRPEPAVVVVVLPATSSWMWLWPLLVAAAAAAVVVRGAASGPGGPWAVADVAWFVGALVLKQAWVLAGADLAFSSSGWCLIAASALTVGAALLLLPGRLRPWVAWGCGVFATAILFADLVHLRFFGDLGSVAGLRSAGQAAQVGSSIVSLLRGGDLWFWADLLPAAVLAGTLARDRCRPQGTVRRAGLAASAAALLAIGGVIAWDGSVSVRQVFHMTQLARHLGVLNLHAADLGRTFAGALVAREASQEDLERAAAFFAEMRPSRQGGGPLFGVARGRNLVMIQVESLQAFVVGYRIGGREVTPFLNRLSAQSFSFAAVTDQTEEGRSSDAELATQVSLLPPDRGAAAFLHAGNSYTGLASVLAEHGYTTLSAVPFDGGFWNRRATHRAYGYETSLFAENFASGETIGWGLNDEDFLVQAARRLEALPEPWCAYLLTLSLHHPFEGFPEHLKRLDVGEWEGTPFGNFLHTMHYFDGALRDFVAGLEESGLLDETVVALWGDHDAGFDWRPEIAAALGTEPDAAGWYLSQRVPLVIRVPGVAGPGEPDPIPAGHVDVAPTLLALLGVDPAPLAYLGRNLLGSPGAGPVVGEYRCWQDRSHLYLRRGPHLEDGECIELEGLRRVSTAACAAAFEDARRQVEVSRSVLELDLQERLRLDRSP